MKINSLDEYDAAKSAASNYKNAGDNVTAEKFERACLEYRREHGIFEVGDWIVIGEYQKVAQFVGFAHAGTPAQLPQIDVDGRLYSSYFAAWQHATDEEIEAAKRGAV